VRFFWIAPLEVDDWNARLGALLGKFRDRRRVVALDLLLKVGGWDVGDTEGGMHLAMRHSSL